MNSKIKIKQMYFIYFLTIFHITEKRLYLKHSADFDFFCLEWSLYNDEPKYVSNLKKLMNHYNTYYCM